MKFIKIISDLKTIEERLFLQGAKNFPDAFALQDTELALKRMPFWNAALSVRVKPYRYTSICGTPILSAIAVWAKFGMRPSCPGK